MIASLLVTLLMTVPTQHYQTSSPSTIPADMNTEIELRVDEIVIRIKGDKELKSGISQFNGLAGPPVKFKMEGGCK